MNKIKIDNDKYYSNITKKINAEYIKNEGFFSINELNIKVFKDVKLDLFLKFDSEIKLNIKINIEKNTKLDLNIYSEVDSGKIQYKYNIEENSTCNVLKYNNSDTLKEMIKVDLNGIKSNINYNFKTISNDKETYDYYIYHNYKNTESNIKNNGVCINNGNIIYQVSTFIPKDNIECIANQNNRIINLTNNKCEIKPNLYIDCNDVEASHSALIGKFSDEEMFYMQSRGLDPDTALKLLINGFLSSDITDKYILNKINKNIKKYWR